MEFLAKCLVHNMNTGIESANEKCFHFNANMQKEKRLLHSDGSLWMKMRNSSVLTGLTALVIANQKNS